MNYRVIIMPTADADIDAIVAYIDRDSVTAATRWLDACFDAIDSLEFMPQRCALAPESETFGRRLRHYIFHAYRIIFDVQNDAVRVLHVRHAARLPAEPDENDAG